MLIIPENIVHSALTKYLTFVKNNFESTVDETDSYLYKVIEVAEMSSRYQFFKQSKELFASKNDNRRKPTVNLFFNAQHNNIPTIHIMPATDSPAPGGIGIDQNYQGKDLNDSDFSEIFTRAFNSSLSIVFTSDNPSEVSLMYSFIRAALIPMMNHFELSGMRNCSLSGSAIQLDEQLVPPNIFTKQIVLSFYYEVDSIDFYKYSYINEINFIQTLNDGN